MSRDKKVTPVQNLWTNIFFGIEHAEKLLHTVLVNEEMKNSRFRLNFTV